MKIVPNAVVSIHYTLTGDDGDVIDSSEGNEPLNFLAGASNIIPGLERALMGLEAGDKTKVTVAPEDGYGEVEEELIQKLPRDMFGGVDTVEVGMSFQAQGPDGTAQFVEVIEVSEQEVTVDGNHLLAGKTLHFDVSVESVREASDTEIEHGHVH